jgi:hypothetical protein
MPYWPSTDSIRLFVGQAVLITDAFAISRLLLRTAKMISSANGDNGLSENLTNGEQGR